MKHILLILFVFIPLFFSCKYPRDKTEEAPVARVFNQYIYPADLDRVITDGIPVDDSIIIARDYIEKWVRKHLLLNKAELNLTEEQKNVNRQIEDYRTSLLIYQYQQNLIEQKIDTVVKPEEIRNYYEENKNAFNFVLKDNIVKALYLKIPRSAPNTWQPRSWYKSNNEEQLKKLEEYCYQNAEQYDYFNDEWILFSEIQKALPITIYQPHNYLKYRKYIETKDSTYYYFVKIREYVLSNDVAPLEYVESDIRSIIINKRKIQLLKELESDIYNDALNRGYFEVYK